MSNNPDPKEPQSPAPRKKRGRTLIMLALPVALALGGGWFWLTGGRFEETENANLHQARIDIASTLSGRVTEVAINDNMPVQKGDLLFVIDPEPYRLALARADAAIATAKLNVAQMKAAYKVAEAQEAVAADEAAYQKSELKRQMSLAEKGVTTDSALDEARHTEQKAQEQLATAHQATLSARAALGDNPEAAVEDHPSVRDAMAARDKAAFDLQMTQVLAPAGGVIYKASSFSAGQFVAAGVSQFTLVETGDYWIEANFKETQLANVQPGQPAKVTFDIYPGQSFTATVSAIGAGTGAEFALLPAQNATGNWVKVTQRIPVRLSLNDMPSGLTLRTGLSATVTVDTGASRTLADLLPDVLATRALAAAQPGTNK